MTSNDLWPPPKIPDHTQIKFAHFIVFQIVFLKCSYFDLKWDLMMLNLVHISMYPWYINNFIPTMNKFGPTAVSYWHFKNLTRRLFRIGIKRLSWLCICSPQLWLNPEASHSYNKHVYLNQHGQQYNYHLPSISLGPTTSSTFSRGLSLGPGWP